jgi:hypothetical protein
MLSGSPVSSPPEESQARFASEILRQSQDQPEQRAPNSLPLLFAQQYLLIWDDKEWNSVKDWVRLAEAAVRKSHRAHGEIALPTTLKVPPTSAGVPI